MSRLARIITTITIESLAGEGGWWLR